MKKYFKIPILILVLSSCSPYWKVASIKTGGYNNGMVDNIRIKTDEIVRTDVDGGSFVRFNNDSTASNTVQVSLLAKERYTPGLPSIDISKPELKVSKKESYAYATIEKFFYKKKELVEVKCKTGNCSNKTYNLKVVLKLNIRCKDDKITENITIHDNLPKGSKLISYKIIKGGEFVSKIEHNSSLQNEQEYHTYNLVGVNNVFDKSKMDIRILQEISFTTLDTYYSKK